MITASYTIFSIMFSLKKSIPDSKVHGANMGPIWGRQDPDGPHVGPMSFAIWVYFSLFHRLMWLGAAKGLLLLSSVPLQI